jgi:hypothetical protein
MSSKRLFGYILTVLAIVLLVIDVCVLMKWIPRIIDDRIAAPAVLVLLLAGRFFRKRAAA